MKKKKFFFFYYKNYLYHLFKYHKHFFKSLINKGNKLWAFNFFLNLKFEFKLKEKIDPLLTFFLIINKIIPEILLFPLNIAGIINEVALMITIKKQITFTIKWIIKWVKDKYRILTLKNISILMLNTLYNKGEILEKKKKYYKIAIKNRYLIHYFIK